MRKIYLMATLLGAGTFAFGQVQQSSIAHKGLAKGLAPTKGVHTPVTNKDDDVIYHDNFETVTFSPVGGTETTGTSNWTANVEGTAPSTNDYGWQIADESYSWRYSQGTFNSTSGGDFAQVNNGNPTLTPGTQAMDVVYTLTSDPIDIESLANGEAVSLSFEQWGALFYDQQEVQLSTDGSTWETVYDNNEKEMLTSGGGDDYANPELVIVPIQHVIQGNSSSVQIRLRWTTRMTAQSSNPNVWVMYGWMVDDIKLQSMLENDIATHGRLFVGSEEMYAYYQIPAEQVQPYNFSINVNNLGSEDQTNVQLNAIETEHGAYNASSAGKIIETMASDSLALSGANAYTPDAAHLGKHIVTFNISADAEDEYENNNIIPNYEFEITEGLYARDEAFETALDPSIGFGYYSGHDDDPMESDAIIMGTVYEIVETATINSIEFRIGGIVEEGALIYAYILDEELLPIPGGDEIGPYIAGPADEGKYVSIEIPGGLSLVPGEYVIAVGSENEAFSVATNGYSFPQTTFIYFENEATWYYTESTPVVRGNFGASTVGISEDSKLLLSNVYPNPFANEATVTYTLEEGANVSYTIVDLAGNVVATANEGNVMPGNHNITVDGTGFANGVYFFNLVAGNNTVTHKIIVNK